MTWLAVPRHHGHAASPALEQWLGERCAQGDEISLHGFTRRDDQPPRGLVDRLCRHVYTRGEGEFWDLPTWEASARLRAGAAWFDQQGWPLHGFVAPAWLMGPGVWHALRDVPALRYASTLHRRQPALLRNTGDQRFGSTGGVPVSSEAPGSSSPATDSCDRSTESSGWG